MFICNPASLDHQKSRLTRGPVSRNKVVNTQGMPSENVPHIHDTPNRKSLFDHVVEHSQWGSFYRLSQSKNEETLPRLPFQTLCPRSLIYGQSQSRECFLPHMWPHTVSHFVNSKRKHGTNGYVWPPRQKRRHRGGSFHYEHSYEALIHYIPHNTQII